MAALAILGDTFPRAILTCSSGSPAADGRIPAGERRARRIPAQAFSWGHRPSPDGPLTLEVTERPLVSPLARLQASRQHSVTNLLHRPIKLQGSLASKLVTLLDGSRDRAAILKDLSPLIERREVVLEQAGQPVDDIGAALQILAAELPAQLERLARLGLLME